MNTINFKLSGLTCEACIKLSTSRLKKIPGVQEVKVDLNTGNVKVASAADIDLDTIKLSLADTDYNIIN